MDEDEQLRNAVKWRTKQKPPRTMRLGETLSELMTNRISPQQAGFGQIAELWSRLLPAELGRHCKINDISGGRLKVLVDTPLYMHELRLCSSEILSQLQQHCHGVRIKEIKIAVGNR